METHNGYNFDVGRQFEGKEGKSFEQWKKEFEILSPPNTMAGIAKFLIKLTEIPLANAPMDISEYIIKKIESAVANLGEVDMWSYVELAKMGKKEKDWVGWMRENGMVSSTLQAVMIPLDKEIAEKHEEIGGGALQLLLALLDKSVQESKRLYAEERRLFEEVEEKEVWNMDDIETEEDEEIWMEEMLSEGTWGVDNVKDLLRMCAETRRKESLPHILSAIEGTKNISCYTLTRAAASAFSAIDAAASAKELLGLLRNSTDRIDEIMYSRILYHLELGRVQIDQGVVQYLEKQYVLQGERAKNTSSAQRITGDGKIGLLDKDGSLLGYFELGDLRGEEIRRAAEVLEVSRELIFANEESPEEIKQQFLRDYGNFYQKFLQKEIGHLRISDLSLREQFWLYRYLNGVDEKTRERVEEIIKQFGRDFVKTFISLESDNMVGEKIVEVAENPKINNEQKDKVFKKYGELIDLLDGVRVMVEKFFLSREKTSQVNTQNITKEIANRASEIISRFAEGIQVDDVESVLKDLEKIRKDTVVFSVMFREAFSHAENIDFEDVAGLNFERKTIEDLSPEGVREMPIEVREMLEISAKNWIQEKMSQEQKKYGEKVVEDFKKVLETREQGNEFHILKKDGKIVGFYRLRQIKERPGHKYFGSFNVDTEYRGSAIGSAMMEKALKAEARKSVLEAVVNHTLDVGMKYVEDLGFVGEGVDEKGRLKIVCDLTRNKRLGSRKLSKDEIIKRAPSDELGILVFDVKKQAGEIPVVLKKKFDDGYVLTRYFSAPKEKNKRYYVFEKGVVVEEEKETRAAA